MPWAKLSDTFALHPKLTGLIRTRGADERTTNEVAGFIDRCASHSAAVMEDYWFDVPIAMAMAPTRWERLIKHAREAGLITDVEGRGMARRFRLVEDDQLFHIRYREDVEWDRQRDRDRRNSDLTMPALLRDGDVCRFCSQVVSWGDRRGGRGGTFEHLEPGRAATIATYVVCCRTCNSKRKDKPDANDLLPVRPAPAVPHYSPQSDTRRRLEAFYGPDSLETARNRLFPNTAANSARPSDPAADARPDDPAANPARLGDQATSDGSAPARARGPSRADPGSFPGSEGGSRDGTGDGVGYGSVPDPAVPQRSRGSRGRRSP